MYPTAQRACRKCTPRIKPIEVAARFDSLTRLLNLKSYRVEESAREEAIDTLLEVREAAQRISTAWPEIGAQCSRAVAAIDRVLSRINDRPEETDSAQLAAAGSGVSA